MNSKEKNRYKAKGKDSFKTKLNLFLFDFVVNSRTDFTEDHFNSFEITDELVLEYTGTYWQQQHDFEIKGKTVASIYKDMQLIRREHSELIKSLQHDYILDKFPVIFPENQFKELVSGHQCHYCGISSKEVDELADKKLLYKKNERGWNLEVDRLNSNYEYTRENCVMACYWCNNAKTDEFTEEEFQEIGRSIKKVWEKRLQP